RRASQKAQPGGRARRYARRRGIRPCFLVCRMSSFLIDSSWLWVPMVLFAALAQTARNAAQRTLTQAIGTLPATLVRFLYGLPFALLWLGFLYLLTPRALPDFTLAYLGWIALGALFQVGGTAMLLLAMRERNFAVAV